LNSFKATADAEKAADEHEEEYDGPTLEDLEEETSGMVWTHVSFPRSCEHLKQMIVSKIGEVIAGSKVFTSDCTYVVEFDTPAPENPDLLRIWVAFLDDQHLKAFQELKTIQLPSEGGKGMIHFQITEPGFQWGEEADDGLVRVLAKNSPKGFSPARLQRSLDKFAWGKAKRPMVKEAKGAHFLTHKGGVVPRAMMVVTVIPHDDDQDCKEVLPVVRIPVGKGKGSSRVLTFILGCSKHSCDVCLRGGHLGAVHEKFAGRSTGGKRKASGALIRDAKRRADVPESDPLKVVREDPPMEFVEGKGLSKEAWRCNICSNKEGGHVFGLSFTEAIAHVGSQKHIKQGETFVILSFLSTGLQCLV
jgi:hypothetical protein